MTIDMKKLKLPAVSQTSLKALELVSAEEFDVVELSEVISRDPVLSSIVMKYANAPIYPRAIGVSNVRNAISLLGQKNIQFAVIVATMRAFTQPSTEALDVLWKHSQRVSVIAKLLARKCFIRLMDDIGLTALVHNMGAMVLASNYTDEYQWILNELQHSAKGIADLEKEKFGVTHDQVLSEIAQKLRLPETSCEAVADFGSGNKVRDLSSDVAKHVAILALAHYIEATHCSEQSVIQETVSEEEYQELCTTLGISEEDIEALTADAKQML